MTSCANAFNKAPIIQRSMLVCKVKSKADTIQLRVSKGMYGKNQINRCNGYIKINLMTDLIHSLARSVTINF